VAPEPDADSVDRIIDNLTGERDRRIVVEGKIQIADLFTFEARAGFSPI